MTSLRTGHDFEHDVLRGATLEQAKEVAERLAAKALALTNHLRFYHYSTTSQVRANLEVERNSLEMESADWSARIAEFTGQIVKVREPAIPMSARARRHREAV